MNLALYAEPNLKEGLLQAAILTASLVSLLIGLVLVNWMEPGKAMHLEKPVADAAGELVKSADEGLSLEKFVSQFSFLITKMFIFWFILIIQFKVFLRSILLCNIFKSIL